MTGALEIVVRKAIQADIDRIAEIAHTLYPNNFNGEGGNSLQEAIEWTRTNMLSDGKISQYLVAEYDGNIVGYSYSRTTANGAGVVSVVEFGAIPPEGVKGIGSKIIEGTQRVWKDEHYARFGKPLTSMLIFTGEAAKNLCERQGFVLESKSEGLYRDATGTPIAEYIMRKDFLQPKL